MVKAKRNKQTVQETNDSSILSKASIAEHGYFDDPYLKLFCSRVVRRSPLIQRGYYIRAKAIDYILKSFLQHHFESTRTQIVSLGAGFDASYFRLKSLNLLPNTTYYDIDFPDVIRRKHNIIQKQSILTDTIGEFQIQDQILRAKDYFTLPCDMTDLVNLEKLLMITNIDFSLPTLFFSECALTYVEYEESKELCKWIRAKFPNVIVMLYEQVSPSDAFGHVMVRHFEKIQSPLKRMHNLDTIWKQKGLFEELGYCATIGFDMNSFYESCVDVKEKCRIEKLEVFDEFEEWHLKCSHYCVVGAFQGTCVDLTSKFIDEKQSTAVSSNQVAHVKPNPFNIKISQLQRFGHSFTKLNENSYLCTGGFGITSENRHDKLDDGFILTFSESKMLACERKVEFELVEMEMKSMYHSMTFVSGSMVFVFGGRTSPKQPKTEYGLYEIDDFMLTPHEIHQLKLDGVDDYGALQPIPRWRHAAVRIGDRIYISGGRSVNNMALNDLWSFRLSSKVWKLEYLGEPLKACHTHTMDVWNNSLVMFGGISNHQVVLDQLTIVALEGSTMKVEEVTFEKVLPRYSHSSHLLNDSLYVIGGIDPSCASQPPIVVISLVEKTWKTIRLPLCDPTRPLMLHNHRSVLLDEHTIVIIGGGGNCFSFGSYFNPDLTVLDISSEAVDVK